MTVISKKRATQRAKKASAASGASHQQALDMVAREAGHPHWGAMRGTLTVKQDGPSAEHKSTRPNLLDPSLLGRGAEVVDACERLLVRHISNSTALSSIVVPVLVRSAIANGLGQDTPLPKADTLSEAVSLLMSEVSEEADARTAEAQQAQAVWHGSWQQILVRRLNMMATVVSISPPDRSRLLAASDDALAKTMDQLLADLQNEEKELVLDGDLAALLPDDFLMKVIVPDDVPIAIGSWQFECLMNMMHSLGAVDGRVEDISFRAAAEVGGSQVLDFGAAILRLGRTFPCRRLVHLLGYRGIVTTHQEYASPFVGFLKKPEGTSPFERWLTDAIDKTEMLRAPFSYNPIDCDEQLMTSRATPVMDALVSCVIVADEMDIAADATAMMTETATVLATAGRAAREIGIVFPQGHVSVRTSLGYVYEAIRNNADRFGQLALFASLHGVQVVDGIDKAGIDCRIVDLALRALRPFGNVTLARAVA